MPRGLKLEIHDNIRLTKATFLSQWKLRWIM